MSDIPFEKKFSKLADYEIKDTIPSLLPYRVGFQLIDKNEDNTRAVGIEAFVVNSLWIYIPIFFLDGRIKGSDIMFIKQMNMCLPTLDNWIYVLKSRGDDLIGEFKKDVPELVKGPQEVSTTSLTDTVEKFASARVKLNIFDCMHKLNKEAKDVFAKCLLDFPEFANETLKYYTPKEISKFAGELASVEEVNPEPSELTVIRSIKDPQAKDLKDKEKKILMQDGIFIQDARKYLSKLFVNRAGGKNVVQNPKESGVFEVFLSDGTFKPYFIIVPENTGWVYLVDFDNPKEYIRQPSDAVFVRDMEDPDEYMKKAIGTKATAQNIVAKFKEQGRTSQGKFSNPKYSTALIIGNTTEVLEFDCYNPSFNNNVLENVTVFKNDEATVNKSIGDTTVPGEGHIYDADIEFTDGEGEFVLMDNKVFVPKNTVVFFSTRERKGGFGTLEDYKKKLFHQAPVDKLQVRKDDDDTFAVEVAGIQQHGMNKQAAMEYLAKDLEIFAGQARQIVNNLEKEAKEFVICFTKPCIEKQAELTQNFKEDEKNSTQNKVVGGSGLQPKQVVEKALERSQDGIKEVFDVSVIKSIIDIADLGDIKKDFLSDMLRAMNSAGKLLFVFYWNYDKFIDTYGKENMDKLENQMKGIFKDLGDIVLFMKEKSLLDGSDASLDNLSEDIGTASEMFE